MTQRLRGRQQGAALADQHLLLLPEGARESDVSGLVAAKNPGAAFHAGAELRISRHAAVHGPLHLDAGAAAAAGVPAPWRLAWSLACPVERDGAPMPGPGDRDGLTRAFPEGLPVAGERRALDLLLALARRLQGAVRCAGRGALLVPDPLAWPGLDVRTPLSLDAAGARALLAPALAGLEVAGERALFAPVAGGVVEVTLEPHDEPPGDAPGDGRGGSTASMRWWPRDPADAEHERPAMPYREERATAVVTMSMMANLLLRAGGGSVVDLGGLPVRDLG